MKEGSKLGMADDFAKEVDEVTKDLQPVLKKVRQERKLAFLNEEKLIINGKIYRKTETKPFPFYGRLMESGISTLKNDIVVNCQNFQALELVLSNRTLRQLKFKQVLVLTVNSATALALCVYVYVNSAIHPVLFCTLYSI